MLVALVDDDEAVCAAMSSLLRAHGHDVRAFASAEAFVLAQLRPTCLVLDNRLAAMSGIELHRHLERTDLLVPVIFVTSSDDSKAELDALVARGVAVAHFRKPFDVAAFLVALDKAGA
jgi:FixJ family two-component response regulator